MSMISAPAGLGLSPRTARAGFWFRVLVGFETWMIRVQQRRALYRLDERARHDLALSAADVEREGGKPFWRA